MSGYDSPGLNRSGVELIFKDQEDTVYDSANKRVVFAHEKKPSLIMEANETEASKKDKVYIATENSRTNAEEDKDSLQED